MPWNLRMRTAGEREIPFLPALGPISAKTAAYTILEEDAGTLYTNRGAAASVTLTLPPPTTVSPGDYFRFKKIADFDLVVNAGVAAGFQGLAATGVTYTNATATNAGSFTAVSDGTKWLIMDTFGTWTLA